jgi:hypothetical protein
MGGLYSITPLLTRGEKIRPCPHAWIGPHRQRETGIFQVPERAWQMAPLFPEAFPLLRLSRETPFPLDGGPALIKLEKPAEMC